MKNDLKKFDDFFQEVKKEWITIGGNIHNPRNLDVELQIYKKMLDLLQVGNSYYFIFVPPLNLIERVSDSIQDILGYQTSSYTIDHFIKGIHPDDLPTFVDFEKRVVEFKMNLSPDKLMKYKSRYNYRIQKSDGTYIPILQQSITIQSDENGAVIRNFIIHTDISEYKTDNVMKLSFIGLDNEPSFLEVARSSIKIQDENLVLTERETQILDLLSKNYTSDKIAEILFVSAETIRTHRKNILKKTKTKSTLQLILLAKEKGWV